MNRKWKKALELHRPEGVTLEALHVSYVNIMMNLILCVGKFIAGILGHSGAMISDAVHSASDVFSTVIALFGMVLSGRTADADHQYGHEKQEYIATLFLAFLLFFTGLSIGYRGLDTILGNKFQHLPAPTMLALGAAVCSIAAKECMFRYTKKAAAAENSGALMAAAWDNRSDALSSIGALVGIVGSMLGYPMLDPLASLVIAWLIIKAAWEIFSDASNKLVDHAAAQTTIDAMRQHVLLQPGVRGIDSIRTRLFGSRIYVDIDISADGNLPLFEAHKIAQEVHDTVEQHFPEVKHCMVHVNPDLRIPERKEAAVLTREEIKRGAEKVKVHTDTKNAVLT